MFRRWRLTFSLLATLALRAVGKANVQNPVDFVLVQSKSKQKETRPDFALFPENHSICLTEKL
ncbi:hypothetical protein [Lonepinella sp. BR2271]|uniref:hypothetical protein n=1 Tax=Lonepinella sp. BR2271 TaxID=3434550 RepID=UPI003F6DC302